MEILIVLIMLFMLGVEDLITKKVFAPLAVLFLVFGFYMPIFRNEDVTEILLMLIPGASVVAISLITNGKIGIGDGIVIAGVSLCLGLQKSIFSILIAFFITAVIGEVMILTNKIKKGEALPFVPFLFLGVAINALIT